MIAQETIDPCSFTTSAVQDGWVFQVCEQKMREDGPAEKLIQQVVEFILQMFFFLSGRISLPLPHPKRIKSE